MSSSRSITRETLAPLPLFEGLAPSTLGEIAAASRLHRAEAYGVIARQGEPAQVVFLVLNGLVRLTRLGDEGRESMLGILGPGALVGDAALLDGDAPFLEGGTYAVTMIAQEDCEYLTFGAKAMMRLMRENATLAFNVARMLARRLRMMVVRDSWMRSLDLPMRLARFLAWHAENEAARLRKRTQISIRISQEQLGRLIGGTRESVNKHLRQWARDGIVEQVEGRLVVLDVERLLRLAEAPPDAFATPPFEKIDAV